jgi:small subunit ribosomal protein S17
MSRTISSLPIRAISSRNQQSLLWTCRRCLATQAESTTNQPEFSPSLPSSQRRNADGKIVPLQRRDWLLKKPLPHAIPGKRLAHTTTDLLPPQEKAQRDSVPKQKRTVGVVISAGLMDRTVTVRLPGQVWNNHIKKVGNYATRPWATLRVKCLTINSGFAKTRNILFTIQIILLSLAT